jgi:hypothetical protein
MDRNVKSAICIENEAMKKIPMDRGELTLGETLSSTFFNTMNIVHGVKESKVRSLSQEAIEKC